jgi:uncharacterized protein
MSVTKQLLDLFTVDKQLRGLRSRLEAAERFLSQQSVQLSEMEKQKVALEAQHKQLRASLANYEGEASRLDARVSALREQMNSAKTAKEYNAFLSELNNYKEQKGQFDERGIEVLTKAEEVAKTLGGINAQFGERSAIVDKARSDRDARSHEIKDKVAELQQQRETVAAAVPQRERIMLEGLIKLRGDEAMAPIEVIDRRNHEYSCSACMMAITVEVVSAVMTGKVANCPSCRCLLYADEASHKEEERPKKPRKTSTKKKAGKGEPATEAAPAADAPSDTPAGAAN